MILIKKLSLKLEIDSAVLFGIFSKLWMFVSGPVSTLLIAVYFSAAVQGYYFTFATLLALQVFVELGLGTVTQQFASHEWSHLSLNDDGVIIGDSKSIEKLSNITRISVKWFLNASIILFIGLSLGGYFFFGSTENYNVNWLFPWISLSILTSFNILIVPFWYILEGCNQVKILYKFKFLQGLLLNLIVWSSIFFGAGLWTTVISSFFTFAFALIFLYIKYKLFFKKLLFSNTTKEIINWKNDIFPMQFRIAVSWISGYFSFSLFTPILFKFQGPIIAGQFGMTWAIVGVFGSIANSWLAPKIPQFAMFIAKKNYSSLDKLFWKLVRIIFIIVTSLSLFFIIFLLILHQLNYPIAIKLSTRFLDILPVIFFMLAQILITTSTPFSAYMRAHKKEPLMFLSLLSAVLISLSTFISGKYYSVLEMSIGYFVVNMFLIPVVIYLWYNFRSREILKNIDNESGSFRKYK